MRRPLAALLLAAATSLSFASPASACAGEVCDAINEVCTIVRGGPCVR